MKKSNTVLYFGGSFDPPHRDHRQIALAALNANAATEIRLAPSWSAPHKQQRRQASYADRLAMTKLLIAEDNNLQVSELEGELKWSPSYTVEVLRELKRREPEKEFGLLIGSDSLLELHSWKEASELVSEFRVVTYPRSEYEVTLEKLKKNWAPEIASKLFSEVLTLPFLALSSSMVRRAGDPSEHHALTPEVSRYIIEHKLYKPEAGGR